MSPRVISPQIPGVDGRWRGCYNEAEHIWQRDKVSMKPVFTDGAWGVPMMLNSTNLSEIRPRLRNDVVFLRVETGIYLRSSETACVLKGRGAYEWMSALGPRMTGELSVFDLLAGLDEDRRRTGLGLLNALLDKGFARNAARYDGAGLTEAESAGFAPQI